VLARGGGVAFPGGAVSPETGAARTSNAGLSVRENDMLRSLPRLLAGVGALALAGCSAMPPKAFPRAEEVDLERLMGSWYVIAHIPPGMTADAYNGVEHYELDEPGVVSVDYSYREGGFDGESERMQMTGYVLDDTDNAVWAMQPFWPLRLENTISYVGEDYEAVIVARSARDYVWVMARSPSVSDDVYADLVNRVERLGYDPDKLRRMPQQPLDERSENGAAPAAFHFAWR